MIEINSLLFASRSSLRSKLREATFGLWFLLTELQTLEKGCSKKEIPIISFCLPVFP